MKSRWRMCYGWSVESDNIRLTVYRRYDDVKDQMSDDPCPEWEGQDDYKVEITELDVEYELIELPRGGFTKYRHETQGEVLTFNGNIDFVDCIRLVAEKYDNFYIVSKVASTLSKN